MRGNVNRLKKEAISAKVCWYNHKVGLDETWEFYFWLITFLQAVVKGNNKNTNKQWYSFILPCSLA